MVPEGVTGSARVQVLSSMMNMMNASPGVVWMEDAYENMVRTGFGYWGHAGLESHPAAVIKFTF